MSFICLILLQLEIPGQPLLAFFDGWPPVSKMVVPFDDQVRAEGMIRLASSASQSRIDRRDPGCSVPGASCPGKGVMSFSRKQETEQLPLAAQGFLGQDTRKHNIDLVLKSVFGEQLQEGSEPA
jgi:hypothetical protein